MERIICAATYWNDGVVRTGLPVNINSGFVFAGWRHGNTLQLGSEMLKMLYGERWLEEWVNLSTRTAF